MKFPSFALLLGAVVGGAGLIWQMIPAKSKLLISRNGTHFPVVSGYNLNRQEFEFPRDFGGELNFVMIPFKQYQQDSINTWIPFAQQVEAIYPGLVYYELPTIYEMPAISRTFLNEGMRAGIPDQTARERTITLYLDKQEFRSALDIPTEDDIHLLLVDREGNIVWRTVGEYTEDKASKIIEVIKERLDSESFKVEEEI
ncbi:hypothetical protein ACFLZW_02795 [Chloroflexota bacterium]